MFRDFSRVCAQNKAFSRAGKITVKIPGFWRSFRILYFEGPINVLLAFVIKGSMDMK